jgi:DNA modification methylase
MERALPIHCAHDEIVALDSLKPNPANPNKHPDAQISLLAKIIKAQGWRNPIVVSNRSGLITKGHARLSAAQLLGLDVAPVDRQDYADEKTEWADMIADNRIAELAEPDRTMLRELAEQLDDGAFDMDLTGFDSDALEELMTAAPPASDVDAEPQIDKADELRKKWGVKRGQIWGLGEHRLMCGDCTKQSAALLNGEVIAFTLTDPPYSVDYSISFSKREGGKNAGHQTAYKESKDARALLFGFLSAVPSGILAMTFPVDRHFSALAEALEIARFESVRELVWVKSSATFHPGQTYQQKHEPLLICRKRSVKYPDTIPADANTVLEFERTSAHDDHPTEKPMRLWTTIMQWHSRPADYVFDPFCGVGTTIIACEQLGRKCRAMEIDPGYVAVSIQRWADATGKIHRLLTEAEPLTNKKSD